MQADSPEGSGLPGSISRSRLLEAIRHLQVPLDDLIKITVDPLEVWVTRLRRDQAGNRVECANDYATETRVIPIVDHPEVKRQE